MNERIKNAYASAPKTWVWQLLAAFIVACLLAWSGTAVRGSSSTGNGLEVAGNILSGIFHPSAKLLLTLGTDGVPYLLLETFCIAFLGSIVGAVISLPLSFLSASNLVPRGVAVIGRVLIASIRTFPAFVYGFMCIRVTGPGPFAGLLTMSLCSIGMVSKMFIESIEDLDKRILESLDAAGCTSFQKIRYCSLPLLSADFSSTKIFAIRASLASCVILPFSTRFCREASSLSLWRCAEATQDAYIRVVWPCAAKTCAMPLPMVPAPKTATFIFVFLL